MEESKNVSIIISVLKVTSITEDDIKEYLNNPKVEIKAITSPKGF